ncbi:MAG: GntR family transcriptional regulator [Planctomycetia bacterium]|nr:GntR family transcriptional regulator [Planctomycetia bacterium]
MSSATKRSSLTDKVYQFLTAQLAGRKMAVGDRINARSVAEELHVSRTTVNKAIDRLASVGWVKSDDGRHPVVAKHPPKLAVHSATEFEFANQTDSTYEAILDRILRGEMRPGEVVKERPLGQALGVNPATVRRAAEWLSNDGLLERLRRRGWRVTTLSARDLKDVYQIRLLLEPLVIEGAVARITDESLAELERETDRLIALGEKATVYDRRHADHQFHQALSEASGNRILTETVEPLIRRALLVTTVGFRYGRASRSFEEHREILEALKARDASKAVKRLKDHLRNALKFNVDAWERQ